MSRSHGLTDEKLLALMEHETSPALTDVERLAVRLATAMTATPADVDEALFAELRRVFDEPQIVELVSAIAWENYRSRFNRPFDVESEGFSDGAMCVLPPHRPQRGAPR